MQFLLFSRPGALRRACMLGFTPLSAGERQRWRGLGEGCPSPLQPIPTHLQPPRRCSLGNLENLLAALGHGWSWISASVYRALPQASWRCLGRRRAGAKGRDDSPGRKTRGGFIVFLVFFPFFGISRVPWG